MTTTALKIISQISKKRGRKRRRRKEEGEEKEKGEKKNQKKHYQPESGQPTELEEMIISC